MRLSVLPTPADAYLAPNAPCRPLARRAPPEVCTFGAGTGQAGRSVALIGDSHAAHWRAALEVVAQARHWRAFSITHSSCPLNTSAPVLATARLTGLCRRWTAAALRWLAEHPEIRTIFLSADASTPYAGPPQDGYRRALGRIPPSVRDIFVLRDTPRISAPQAPCVDRAIRLRRPAGVRCAQPRATNLPPDPLVAAARTVRRTHVIDLTAHTCTRTRCLAVVGGVLVRKDGTHLTSLFSTTLGPYVLRAVSRTLVPRRSPP